MQSAVGERQEQGLENLLKEAHASLDRGDVRSGRETSQRILKEAEASGHRHFEARALLCLAHCDRMLSRYRRAHRASQRAAQLFQVLGDTSGEVMALTTHAFRLDQPRAQRRGRRGRTAERAPEPVPGEGRAQCAFLQRAGCRLFLEPQLREGRTGPAYRHPDCRARPTGDEHLPAAREPVVDRGDPGVLRALLRGCTARAGPAAHPARGHHRGHGRG
jgi:hypothetical protein